LVLFGETKLPEITKKVIATPGEKVAVIEEFNSGEGTYLQESNVRSLHVGEIRKNLSERSINIKHPDSKNILPQLGDIITGVVETAQTKIANICIESINGKLSKAGFTGMLQLISNQSSGRGRVKRGATCRSGDIVRALVFSIANSTIHLSIDRPDLGVLKATCSMCGGDFVRLDDRLKCVDCGFIEERRLSSEYGNK
jgi:exosome complex component CSL4|tara:strand:- start:16912 stop:17505 length:594 start_codon:yes stop_codon:yes gene_type:complete